MRARFVLAEAGVGLRRNLSMSIAMIITVAISLGLFGAGWIVQQRVEDMKDYYYYRVEVSVFLKDDITADQRSALQRQLEADPLIRSVLYESKEQAYARFAQQFKDSPDLVRNVRTNALPQSFRVKLKDPTQFKLVSSSVENAAGVDQVVDQRQILDKIFVILNGFRDAAIAVALVQGIAAVFLIANAVQVAAHSRRREIGVMRLVGASRLYVQVPFLLEAAFAGLIGAGLAVLGLFGIKTFLVDDKLSSLFKTGVVPRITTEHIMHVAPLLMVTGAGLASVAAVITIHRYVRY